MMELTTNPAASESSAPVSNAHRAWLFWGVVLAFAGSALYLAFWAPGISDRYQAGEAALHQWVASLFPPQVHSAIIGAEHVFLTPWLYLTMMVVWFAERMFPADPNQKFFSVGMIQDLITWFTFNSFLRVLTIGFFVKVLQFVLATYAPFLILVESSIWRPAVAVMGGIVLVDFLNWFHHYLRHRVPLLWSFHAIHHSQKEMNMFTDLRVHLIEYLIAKPIVLIPLFMLGLSGLQVIWVVVLLSAYSHLYHANIRSSFGPLRYILVTPQSHRIHHSADPKHRDTNFAVVFCIWDRLFGTQWHDHTEYPETGIYDQGFPHEQDTGIRHLVSSYFKQTLYPFRVILNAMQGKGWELKPDSKHESKS